MNICNMTKTLAVGCALCAATFLFCDNGTGSGGMEYKKLTVLTPKNGDSLTVGETVTVSWGYPKDWPYTQVRILLYGKQGIESLGDIHNPVNKPQDTIQWIVKSTQKCEDCFIEVREYYDNDQAVSEGFFDVTE